MKDILANSTWQDVEQLGYNWPENIRNEWQREYVTCSFQARFVEITWWECFIEVQEALCLPVKPHSAWPKNRDKLLQCLFVYKAALVIRSGLICENICGLDLCIPNDLCILIREFIGNEPNHVCEEKKQTLFTY